MKERRRRLSRRAIEAGVVAYCVAAGSIGGAIYASHFVTRFADIPLPRLIVWQSVIYVAWAVVLPLIAAAIHTTTPIRTIARLTLLAFVVIPIHAAITEVGMRLAHPTAEARRLTLGDLQQRIVSRIPIDLIFYSAIAAILFGRAYAATLASERAGRVEAERAAVAAQLGALRSRLQPHFLFNALQGIGVLIEESPGHAAEMLQKLSTLLRLTLDRSENDVSRLDEELRFLRIYIELETMRFPDRLRYTESIGDDSRDAVLPTFLLQPLVENAIRHNLGRSSDPLTIALSARVDRQRLEIEIADDGVGLVGDVDFGTGLTVTTEQLLALYGAKASLALRRREPRGARVTITLPLAVPP